MNTEEIFEKIEEYRTCELQSEETHWNNREINIPVLNKKFKVNGFGVCENSKFEKGSYRYYLEFNIDNNKSNKSLTVLLMNPSDKTYPDKHIDNTIKNALRIGFVEKYSKVIILNSFAKICGNGSEAETYYNNMTDNDKCIEDENKKFVEEILKNAEDILFACGGKVLEELYQNYLTILKNSNKKIWSYATDRTKSKNRPRHLSTQSPENRTRFNEFIKKPTKYELKIIDNNGVLSIK